MSSPIQRTSTLVAESVSIEWRSAVAVSSVLVSTQSWSTPFLVKPLAISVISGFMPSPIRTTRLPFNFAKSFSLGDSSSSPSVTERSNFKPPEGWKVSPLTISSARWKTVDRPTCSSVGILCKWSLLRMPDSIWDADFLLASLSKKGDGASTNEPRNSSLSSSVKIPARTSRSTSFTAIPMCIKHWLALPVPPDSLTWS